jgi:hypothetical protein
MAELTEARRQAEAALREVTRPRKLSATGSSKHG